MKAKWRKVAMAVTAFVMASTMAVGFTACGGNKPPKKTDLEIYFEESAAIYSDVLGEFKAAYDVAKAETNDSKRYALMAIAEAKLLESGVMLPSSTNGGRYAISRAVPYSATTVLWGNDSYRYHDMLLATEPLKKADRTHLKEKYAETETADEYMTYAKNYLQTQGYTLKNTYDIGYSSDPVTYDVLNTSEAVDSEVLVNTYDGLLEYDQKNNLKPALSTNIPDPVENNDGTVSYTFNIRTGVKWVNSQGNEVADVKADDFAAGLQHMLDAKAGLEYLVDGVIVGAHEYIEGETTDFGDVGITVDETNNTVTYTLVKPTSYFLTMLGYGVFAPMSRSYYTSLGGGFGEEFSEENSSYTYGTSPETIAYCGPYTITAATKDTVLEFSANTSYWNKENININKITWHFNDGSDATKAYNDMKVGTIDGCGLTSEALESAKTDKVGATNDSWFDTYSYVSGTDATTFSVFFNINRKAFADGYDGNAVSAQTEDQKALIHEAMQSKHFRLALAFSMSREAYNAVATGDELALNSLRNSYTPGNFVSLAEDVTVSINGTSTVFEAGTYYGEILQAQLDADDAKIKAWDPNADEGLGSSDGFDGWFNAENALAEFNLALAELEEAGYTVDTNNPIHIDLPVYTTSPMYNARGQALKQSIENVFGGKVVVDFISVTQYQWYYSGYFCDYGSECSYDMYDLSGWGPDYGDPATYLDTFLDGAGYMTKCIGIY